VPYANPADAKAQHARHYQANRERLLRASADRRAAKCDEINAQQADYRARLRSEASATAATRDMPLCACGCGRTTTIVPRGPRRGEVNTHLKGHRSKGVGRFISVQGYVMVRAPWHPKASRGYVAEHTLVAERALGKFLPDGAVVHHVDQVKTHNDPSNLVVCQDAAYHALLHYRLRMVAA
jgi:hypothetical protein